MSTPTSIGWRFSPSKVEIIAILNSLNNGASLPGIEVHQRYDVFDNLTPKELFQATDLSNTNNSDNSIGRYFYTPLKRLANGEDFKRTIVKLKESSGKLECVGTWKGETTSDQIYDPKTRSLIGEMRVFTFSDSICGKRKRGDEGDHHWVMKAFCAAGDSVKDKDPNSDLFSICKIYAKAPKKRDITLQTTSQSIKIEDPGSVITQEKSDWTYLMEFADAMEKRHSIVN